MLDEVIGSISSEKIKLNLIVSACGGIAVWCVLVVGWLRGLM